MGAFYRNTSRVVSRAPGAEHEGTEAALAQLESGRVRPRRHRVELPGSTMEQPEGSRGNRRGWPRSRRFGKWQHAATRAGGPAARGQARDGEGEAGIVGTAQWHGLVATVRRVTLNSRRGMSSYLVQRAR